MLLIDYPRWSWKKKNKQTCKNVVTGANSSWLSPNFCYLFNNGIASQVFKVAKTNNSQFTARHPDLSLGQWRMFILLWYISAAKDYPTEIGNADLHNHLACPWVHENYHCSVNSMTYPILRHIDTWKFLMKVKYKKWNHTCFNCHCSFFEWKFT